MPPRAEGRGAGKRARPRSDADAAAEVMNGEDVATFRARFSRADSRARGSWDERGARAAAKERASAEQSCIDWQGRLDMKRGEIAKAAGEKGCLLDAVAGEKLEGVLDHRHVRER